MSDATLVPDATLAQQATSPQHLSKRQLPPNLMALNDRELEVLRLSCRDYRVRDIAHHLCLSVRTVEGYRTKICHKLNTRTFLGAVALGAKHGLL